MYCMKCGSVNVDGSKFCQKCGTTLAASPQSGPPNQGGYPNQMYPPNQGFNPGPFPPKKKNKGVAVAIIALVAVLIIVPVLILASSGDSKNTTALSSPGSSHSGGGTSAPSAIASDGYRENYTNILGDGKDKVTVMIYICGADLESDNGCATLDINEILDANLSSNVTVILETGGCTSWSTKGIKDGAVQRWLVKDGKLQQLQDLGKTAMLSADQVTDFIDFSTKNYPANRYELIFWDHGGGSLYGYGSDEVYPKTVLFLPDIAEALKNSGVQFDFVGFDACLMGSVETAYMLEPYADYMIASEESEPAYGWDYTPWLNALSENTSIDTVDLGKAVVDSFMEANAPQSGEKDNGDNTLSVVALREMPHVYEELCNYMAGATEALTDKEFKTLSSAVAHTRSFADGEYDMIDLQDFANRTKLDGKDSLDAALNSAVKYNQSTAKSGVYGLSLYFPYTDLSVYSYAKEKFGDFGFGGTIYKFYDKFVNILAGGQMTSNSRSLKENLTNQQDTQANYSTYSWYDSTQAQTDTTEDINYTELQIKKDATTGDYYLPLTDEEWSLLTDVQLQVLLDDGAGYIDLGSDQKYNTDTTGNLLLDYDKDNSWVAIGGQIVSYYAESTTEMDDGTTVFLGYVPAVLNDKTDIDIILEWDGENADGYIAGYRLTESNSTIGGAGTLGKGHKQFKKGDKVDFVCDYYTYDGAYDDSYFLGDQITIGDALPTVTYEDIGESHVLMCYMLVDIYHNESWTETVEFGAAATGN